MEAPGRNDKELISWSEELSQADSTSQTKTWI